LRPGFEIPRLIKGGWQLAGGHGKVDVEAAVTDMFAFFDAGMTAFDFSGIYTGVEEMVGEFLKQLRNDRGTEAAEAVHILAKIVPDRDALADVDKAYIERIIDLSLSRLNVERLESVQYYWWDAAVPGNLDTLGWLEELRIAGKIGWLGVTNFDTPRLAEMASSGIDIATNQIQYSLLDTRPENAQLALCREKDIKIFCFGVLAGGFLTGHWLGKPDPGYEFVNRSLIKYRLIIDEFDGWELFQDLLAALDEVAGRHGVSLAIVATRWMLENDDVAAVIIGARYARNLAENMQVFEFSLNEQDRAEINAVLDRRNGPAGDVYGLEGDRDGPHGRIMKYNLNDGRA
jgi:aryl-alcohol dehydrogenase-like predicted oxidoreductase